MDRPTLPQEPSGAHELLLPLDEAPQRRPRPRRVAQGRSYGGFLLLGLLAGLGAAGYLLVVVPLREDNASLRQQVRDRHDVATRQLAQIAGLEQQVAELGRVPVASQGAGAELLAWSDRLAEQIHGTAAFSAQSDRGVMKVARAETAVDVWLLPGALDGHNGPSEGVATGLAAAFAAAERVARPQGPNRLAITLWRLDHRGAMPPERRMQRHGRARGALDGDEVRLRRAIGLDQVSAWRVGSGTLSAWPAFATPPVRGRDERQSVLLRFELEPRPR